MKDDAIRQSMASIENRVRHVYNQGFEAGRKAERKTGKWISHIEISKHGDIQCWVCSECSELFSYDAETGIEITDYRHCPKCGAEMEGAGNGKF